MKRLKRPLRIDETKRTPWWWLGYRQHKGMETRKRYAREMAERGLKEDKIAEILRVSVRTVREYIGPPPKPEPEKRPRQQGTLF